MDGVDVLKKCERVEGFLSFVPGNYNLYQGGNKVYLLHKIKLVASFRSDDGKVSLKIIRAINRHKRYRYA